MKKHCRITIIGSAAYVVLFHNSTARLPKCFVKLITKTEASTLTKQPLE